uniref:Uncharacterized protein n=1 Tax=Arabidopsis thaliana TaxID=3702 RepID=Q1PEV7_ARATH|nr:unknown [Arabidopsis thaliana]
MDKKNRYLVPLHRPLRRWIIFLVQESLTRILHQQQDCSNPSSHHLQR